LLELAEPYRSLIDSGGTAMAKTAGGQPLPRLFAIVLSAACAVVPVVFMPTTDARAQPAVASRPAALIDYAGSRVRPPLMRGDASEELPPYVPGQLIVKYRPSVTE